MAIPTEFPALTACLPPRMAGRFPGAVDILRQGLAARSVRKVELDDAKSLLGRVFEKAWEHHVSAPYFHAGRFREQPEDVQALYDSISAWSLHQVPSIFRKIDKAGLHGQVVDAMRAVIDEALPLAEAVRELKPHIVKGRAPNANPHAAPPKEHKNGTGTCACCFSGVAITDTGRMAHHGYRRPGDGFQTSSCSGIRFPPLEVSTEGLEWLIGERQRRHDNVRATIAALPERTEIRWHARVRPGVTEPRVSRPGDDNWDRVKRGYEADLHRQDRAMTSELEFLRGELAKWAAPEPGAADANTESQPEI